MGDGSRRKASSCCRRRYSICGIYAEGQFKTAVEDTLQDHVWRVFKRSQPWWKRCLLNRKNYRIDVAFDQFRFYDVETPVFTEMYPSALKVHAEDSSEYLSVDLSPQDTISKNEIRLKKLRTARNTVSTLVVMPPEGVLCSICHLRKPVGAKYRLSNLPFCFSHWRSARNVFDSEGKRSDVVLIRT